MNLIEKLLRKISRKDRERLLHLVHRLGNNQLKGLTIQKLQGTDFYRVRSGRFRIIFHRDDHTKEVIIDSIRLRREDTYKGF